MSSQGKGASTKSAKEAIEEVTNATSRLWSALGNAAPGKAPIAALAVALSPVMGPKVNDLCKKVCELGTAPASQVLTRFHEAVAAIGSAKTTTTATPTAAIASSSGTQSSVTTIAPPQSAPAQHGADEVSPIVLLTKFRQWLQLQPPEKTCGQLATELSAWLAPLESATKVASPPSATDSK